MGELLDSLFFSLFLLLFQCPLKHKMAAGDNLVLLCCVLAFIIRKTKTMPILSQKSNYRLSQNQLRNIKQEEQNLFTALYNDQKRIF